MGIWLEMGADRVGKMNVTQSMEGFEPLPIKFELLLLSNGNIFIIF